MISISFLLGLGPSANTPDPAHEISTKGPYAFDGFGQTDRPHFIKVLDVHIYVYISYKYKERGYTICFLLVLDA